MEEVINDVTEERKVIHVEGYMEIKFCLQLHCKTIPPCRSETASSNGFGTYSLFFFVFFPIKIYLDCPLLTMYQNQYRLSAYFSPHVLLPFVFQYIHVPVIAPNQLRMLGISLWLTWIPLTNLRPSARPITQLVCWFLFQDVDKERVGLEEKEQLLEEKRTGKIFPGCLGFLHQVYLSDVNFRFDFGIHVHHNEWSHEC